MGRFKKTAEDRALSKLGLGPLAFLTVFTSEAQKLAENVASILKKATVDKTQVMTQISDIRDAGKGWFKSALSGYRKSLARSIGITQNRVTSRVDLTSLDFVNTLELSKELDGATIDWISNLISPDTTNPDTLEPDPSARLKTRFELTLINKYVQDITYSTTNNLSSEELLAKILQKIKRENTANSKITNQWFAELSYC